jgi:hypothetical protein
MEPKKDKYGWPYFNDLPDGFKNAELDDFYDDDDHLLIGTAFLVRSYKYPDRYWAYRVKKSFPYPDTEFNSFLEAGRVFIYDKR